MAIAYAENFLTLRKTYPRWTGRHVNRLKVADPATATELDYRDLLSGANVNYFQREFAIALQNYLELRHKILVQSHPEMPALPGGAGILDIDITK